MLIIVIALMSVGFAQLARREQQTALNNQLSSQAYYAAESGINDAFYDLTNIKTGGGAPCADYTAGTEPYINTCNADNHHCMDTSTLSHSAKSYNSVIDSSSDIAITCLLVDLQPYDLEYSNIDVFSSRYVIFNTDQPLDTLIFTWQSSDEKDPSGGITSRFPTSTTDGFLPTDLWKQKNYPAVIQINITPLSSSFTRSDLLNKTASFFIYPSTHLGGNYDEHFLDYSTYINNGPQFNPTVLSGACGPGSTAFDYECDARLQNITGGKGPYLLSFTNYYDKSDIKIRACQGSGDCGVSQGGVELTNSLHFKNAQAVVDVTARARNVVKRLQEYIPINQQYNLPKFALEAQDICKQFSTGPPPFITRFNTSLPGCNFN